MLLVDTDILIAHLRGVPAAQSWLLEHRKQAALHISVVSVTELVGGMRSRERSQVWSLLGALHVEPVTELIGRRAGTHMRTYRRSHSGIALGDYLIAATAEERGLELATLNIKHFPMFDDIQAPFAV